MNKKELIEKVGRKPYTIEGLANMFLHPGYYGLNSCCAEAHSNYSRKTCYFTRESLDSSMEISIRDIFGTSRIYVSHDVFKDLAEEVHQLRINKGLTQSE